LERLRNGRVVCAESFVERPHSGIKHNGRGGHRARANRRARRATDCAAQRRACCNGRNAASDRAKNAGCGGLRRDERLLVRQFWRSLSGLLLNRRRHVHAVCS
jgi:hypothetical protein